MKAIGSAFTRGVLAMAGRRSPWGGGNKGSEEGSGETGGGRGEIEGDGSDDSDSPQEPSRGPRNPWLPPDSSRPRRSANIEDIFRPRDRRRPPGGGGGGMPRFPQRPGGGSWFPIIIGGIVLLWIGMSSVHQIGPKEEAVVTTFGKYSRTLGPGLNWTLPWPIQNVDVTDVTSIKIETIPDSENEKLMLTSDQNLVDFSYLVRWNIKDLKLYHFRLFDPPQTVREVAEASMRASVAEVGLVDVIGGAGRAQIEQNTRTRMQKILDAYRSGVQIQGVEIKKADPPAKVNDAFQQVTSAQQDAERMQSDAQAWAQQLLAQAQGDAAAFDKVYAEYRLAPEVTRRRMYYETMERVLAGNDKVIVEADGVTPYLPLPEVRRKKTGTTTSTVEGGQ